MLSTLEYQYIRHDLPSQLQDQIENEPIPAAIDSWGRAALPIKTKLKLNTNERTSVTGDNKSTQSR